METQSSHQQKERVRRKNAAGTAQIERAKEPARLLVLRPDQDGGDEKPAQDKKEIHAIQSRGMRRAW
jgi:hypothetical protein